MRNLNKLLFLFLHELISEIIMAIPLLAIGALTALAQGASTLAGTSAAARKNRETQQLINDNLKRSEAERMAKPNNYLDTVSGKAIATQAGQALRENNQALNNNAIKTGATEEQRLASQGQSQQAYNNVMQGLAQQSEAYNQANDKILQTARDQYTKGQTAINNSAAQSYVNAGVGMANALGSLGNAWMGYQQNQPIDVSERDVNKIIRQNDKDELKYFFNEVQSDLPQPQPMKTSLGGGSQKITLPGQSKSIAQNTYNPQATLRGIFNHFTQRKNFA